jgi:dynein intermediate chain, cytosolic
LTKALEAGYIQVIIFTLYIRQHLSHKLYIKTMADAARSQRQAALEEKKKRLEELKARRQQRTTTSLSSQDQARAKIESSANLEDYIDGLLKAPAASPSVAATNNAAASSTDAVENGFKTGEDMNKPAPATSEDKPSSTSAPAPPPAVMKPKAEMFEMATQTSDDDFPEPPGMEDLEGPRKQQQSPEEETKDSDVLPVSTDEAEILEAKVLSAEEVEKELSSEVFSSFLNSTSKKVERVLGSELLADLLVDYDGVSDAAKRAPTKASDGSKYLSSRQIYECPKWTASRDVTDMDWSPLHRELMLCGYHMRTSSFSLAQPIGSSATKVVSPDDTPSDSLAPRSGELLSDGLALVWNLAMPNRPEHIFTCGSPVTTVRFHPTEATLIIGGCQSGQVVVWDVRAGRMPVQKSVLTTTASGNSKGHTHPICAMQVIEGGVSSTRSLSLTRGWKGYSHVFCWFVSL